MDAEARDRIRRDITQKVWLLKQEKDNKKAADRGFNERIKELEADIFKRASQLHESHPDLFDQGAPAEPGWPCDVCGMVNPEEAEECAGCGKVRVVDADYETVEDEQLDALVMGFTEYSKRVGSLLEERYGVTLKEVGAEHSLRPIYDNRETAEEAVEYYASKHDLAEVK